MDLKAALFDAGLQPKMSSFVAGLGGRDVRPDQLAETATKAVNNDPADGWMDIRA